MKTPRNDNLLRKYAASVTQLSYCLRPGLAGVAVMMTKDSFRNLFIRALNVAANNIDKKLKTPISRSFLIELYAPGASGRLVTVDEALDQLYLGNDRFYRIIDVAIEKLMPDRSFAFVRVSEHPPAGFEQTCDPAGLGPFKHVLARHIEDHLTSDTGNGESIETFIGEKLSAVTFVLDYWQLQFDGPMMTALTHIEVCTNGCIVRDGDDQFRNRLCGQIGKIVERVDQTPEAITIRFADNSLISISLRDQDYRGPEAAIFHGSGGKIFYIV
jgi:hypothetical protein